MIVVGTRSTKEAGLILHPSAPVRKRTRFQDRSTIPIHPAALPGRLHRSMRSAPVSLRAFTSARIDAGSCESSVSRAARDVDVLDRLASAARASLMRVTVALERALMPALTYASVQKDVLLAVVSAA